MIIAGFGFRTSASLDSLRSAYEMAARGHEVVGLATADDKAKSVCFTTLAQTLGLPIHAITATEISSCKTTTQSKRVLQERATGSLAEATALAAADALNGNGSRLISPRHISQDGKATCALATVLGTKLPLGENT